MVMKKTVTQVFFMLFKAIYHPASKTDKFIIESNNLRNELSASIHVAKGKQVKVSKLEENIEIQGMHGILPDIYSQTSIFNFFF